MFYPYSPSARFPAVGSGGRTACAGPVYRFDPSLASEVKLPATLDGCLFIYDWERHWILAIHPTADGQPGRIERFAPDIDLKRPVEMELGPDGALYVIEFGSGWENNKDSRVVRIESVPVR
jgi:cytochrome c